jgi:hypothetical protein
VTASIADGIRASVEAVPVGTFIRSADVPGSRAAVNTALSRLARAGDLVRVRNGLYWKGVKSRFGTGRPGLLDAAIAAAGIDGAGLSTQLPATPEVAVAGPVPSFEGVRFHKRNNLARRNLGFWEIALLEALRSYPAYAEVGLDELATRACSLSAEGKVRFPSLESAARSERSPALRRNLAAVIARLPDDMAP